MSQTDATNSEINAGGAAPEAIFLTGRFRSGTTLLWNIFRNIPDFCVYYEPMHDMLPERLKMLTLPSPTHRNVRSYWDEYSHVHKGLADYHKKEFGVTRLLLESDSEFPELESYIRFLIDAAKPKRAALGCCRIDYRLPWLRSRFPGAKIVHMFRDPRDQWYSMVRGERPLRWGDPEWNTDYDLITWSCALWEELPFLISDFITNLYHRHYLLWHLSKLMGRRHADVSIDYDNELLKDPEKCISDMLSKLGIEADVPPLAGLVVPSPVTIDWREYVKEENLQAVEEICDELLGRLGLLADFGKKPLRQIVAEHHDEWDKFSGTTGRVATERALVLFSETRSRGSEAYHGLRGRFRLASSLYNAGRGGIRDLPRRVAEAKFVGNPAENAKLAREEFDAGRTILESLPPMVTFALTTCCNNRIPCLVCDRNIRQRSIERDTVAGVVRAVEPVIKTARYLMLHTGGEPMMSRFYDDVIAMVNPPTAVSFATNAMLMTKERADLMLERAIMSKLVISLDAATPQMYRIMRPGSKFETVIDNVKYYTARAKELQREGAGVELNMTICKTNLGDVPKLVDLAVEVGAWGLSFQRLNTGLSFTVKTVDGDDWNYEDQGTLEDPAVVDRTILETYRRAKDVGLEIMYTGSLLDETIADERNCEAVRELTGKVPFEPEAPKETPSGLSGPRRCRKRWEEVNIMPDGEVRVCCYHAMPRGTIGNVRGTDFAAIWNSDRMIAERMLVLSGRWPDSCATAPAVCVHRGRR